MPIAKETDFVSGVTPVSEAFMDLFQEMLAAYVSPNFLLEEQSATSVRVPAGDDSASVGIAVNGEFRRRDTAASAAVSGSAGTHSVYVTADSADNLFDLEVTDGAPAATNFRKVGEVEWSGTVITEIRQEWPSSARLVAESVDALQLSLVPVGSTQMWPYSLAPNGYQLAKGQAVSRASYPQLHSLAQADGYPHGAGDGSTTFNLPDLRRRMPVGKADSGTVSTLGETGGSWDHVHTNPSTSTVSSHSHSQGTTGSGGSHAHSQSNTGSGGSHAHSNPSTGSGSGHTHSLIYNTVGTTEFLHVDPSASDHSGHGSNKRHPNSGTATSGGSSHTHTTSNTNSGGSHAHTNPNVNSNGSHTHTNPSTSSAGGHSHTQGSTGSANPPYIVVNFIIRMG